MRKILTLTAVGVAALSLTWSGTTQAFGAVGTPVPLIQNGSTTTTLASLPAAQSVTSSTLKQVTKLTAGVKTGNAIAAPFVSYTFKKIYNQWGGQCLDGDRNTIPNNGAKVQLWGCNAWNNQTWIMTPVNGLPVGYYYIQNGYGGQCLDGDRTTIPANGSKAQLWACNGWTNQVWIWTGSRFQNYYGNQCLDGDRTAIPNNGAKVQLWACNGWSNQGWTLSN
jgi:hypothetical protein